MIIHAVSNKLISNFKIDNNPLGAKSRIYGICLLVKAFDHDPIKTISLMRVDRNEMTTKDNFRLHLGPQKVRYCGKIW